MNGRRVVSWALVAALPAVVAVIPAVSTAGIPWPIGQTTCECHGDPAGGASTQLPFHCTLSPRGGAASEDIHVVLTVLDSLGPRVGAHVTVVAVNMAGSVFHWDDGMSPAGDVDEDPQTGMTDAAGKFEAIYDEAGETAMGVFPNLDFSLTIQGPGPGGPIVMPACAHTLSVIDYDLNGSGTVDLVDLALFAGAMASDDLRADFDWSGGADAVDLVDFALFGSQLGASLNAQ